MCKKIVRISDRVTQNDFNILLLNELLDVAARQRTMMECFARIFAGMDADTEVFNAKLKELTDRRDQHLSDIMARISTEYDLI